MQYTIAFVSFIAAVRCQEQEIVLPDTHFKEIKDLDDLTSAVHNNYFSDNDNSNKTFILDSIIDSAETPTTKSKSSEQTLKKSSITELVTEEYEREGSKKESPVTFSPPEEFQTFLPNHYSYNFTHVSSNPNPYRKKSRSKYKDFWSRISADENLTMRKTIYNWKDWRPAATSQRPDVVASDQKYLFDNATSEKDNPFDFLINNTRNFGKPEDNDDITLRELQFPESQPRNTDTKLNNKDNTFPTPFDASVTEENDINFDDIKFLFLRSNTNEGQNQKSKVEMNIEPVTDILINIPSEIKESQSKQKPHLESIADILMRSAQHEDVTTAKNVLVTNFFKIDGNNGDPKYSLVEKPSYMMNAESRSVIFAKPVVNSENTFNLNGEDIEHLVNPKSNEEDIKDFSKSTYIGVPIQMLMKMLHPSLTMDIDIDTGSPMQGAHELNSGVVSFIKNSVRNVEGLVYR